MIRMESVYKSYNDQVAVKDLSLDIKEGDVCVLLGPSGCGKSTTIRLMNKLLCPTRGNIYVDDKNVNNYPLEKLRQKMGYVVQSTGLFPHLNVWDNIATVPKLLKWDRQRIASRIEEMLSIVGLDYGIYYKKYPSELSGGEAQRVGVARALAADPPILLMDEPFGAVDPLNRKRLQNEFFKIQNKVKKTVVFVTHDVEEAIKMGDRIAIIDKGELLEYDTPEGLIIRNKSQFVKDFLGSEYAIKLLAKFQANELTRPLKTSGSASVASDANLQAVLALMIEKTTSEISVLDADGQVKGYITISDIVNILKNFEG